MTKVRGSNTSMIDDRRSSGGGGGGGLGGMLGGRGGGIPLPGKLGGGAIGIIVALAVFLLPRLLGGSGTDTNTVGGVGGGSSQSADSADGACSSEQEQILCGATEDVQNFWDREFTADGRSYEFTKTVFFADATNTGCGQASAQTGPFYCPADNLVYFDLEFLVQLEDQLGLVGDLASQYIVAHEYGHHVQNVLGTNAQVQQAQQNDPGNANKYSIALELQADCYAGAWAHDANQRGLLDNASEINEALDAASAVGDDRIQERTQGRADPETFNHGTSEQRRSWFNRGFTSGDYEQCNTFTEL